jgi:hypothetical protein
MIPETIGDRVRRAEDLARRARRRAEKLTEPDRSRLLRHAAELEAFAAELVQAHHAGVMGQTAGSQSTVGEQHV